LFAADDRVMNASPRRCLILACGNPLREDDGVGPWLAEWALERFREDSRVQIECRQQWTPELAEQIVQTESVIFVDCAVDAAPGSVRVVPVEASADLPRLLTHHLNAGELLALTRDYYNYAPRAALFLTVGSARMGMGEGLSETVRASLPSACELLEETVVRLLSSDQNAATV
jgi:hydrogenase maturation protease